MELETRVRKVIDQLFDVATFTADVPEGQEEQLMDKMCVCRNGSRRPNAADTSWMFLMQSRDDRFLGERNEHRTAA